MRYGVRLRRSPQTAQRDAAYCHHGTISPNGVSRRTAGIRRTIRRPGYPSVSAFTMERSSVGPNRAGLGHLKVRIVENARAAFIPGLSPYDLIQLPQLQSSFLNAFRASSASSNYRTIRQICLTRWSRLASCSVGRAVSSPSHASQVQSMALPVVTQSSHGRQPQDGESLRRQMGQASRG